ncbi:MAG: anti-sigma F factor [Clostridia bacterium]|nr:anti-sigma F factor [Clostridia bacterium]
MKNNYMSLKFKSISENESFARNVVGCFALQLNPTLMDVSDIKTAVSEAVTNCIVHGYPEKPGDITIDAYIENNVIHINVFDNGIGISNISQALEPFYTTKTDEERSGMGFTIMQNFMDSIKVESNINAGTKVYMSKTIKADA